MVMEILLIIATLYVQINFVVHQRYQTTYTNVLLGQHFIMVVELIVGLALPAIILFYAEGIPGFYLILRLQTKLYSGKFKL